MLLCASNVLFITYSEALILASVNLYVYSECRSLTRTSVRVQIKLIGLHENFVKKFSIIFISNYDDNVIKVIRDN